MGSGDPSRLWPSPGERGEGRGARDDSKNAFFGFGTVDDASRFDNISITGELVPEPSTLCLAIFGLVGLIGFGRRRKR